VGAPALAKHHREMARNAQHPHERDLHRRCDARHEQAARDPLSRARRRSTPAGEAETRLRQQFARVCATSAAALAPAQAPGR